MPEKSERPTTPPSFDVERYAKESDERLLQAMPATASEVPQSAVHSHTPTPASEERLASRPDVAPVMSDESWAGIVSGCPVVVLGAEALKRLPLDNRAGFVISLMDGNVDLDTLVDISGMTRAYVLRFVRDLFESGVVEFR
jgi:hypothetical protein